jgi:flagellar biosynthesis anti-sigma factor FlgM
MSEVNPIAGSSAAPLSSPIQRAQIDPAAVTAGASPTQGTARAQMHDRVELSEHARHLDRLRSMPDVRQAKIEAARSAIAEGVFETPDRLRAALLKMLDEVEPG